MLRLIVAASFFAVVTHASASLFDTIDSVETLQTIAANKDKKPADRMPAGSESKPTEETTQKTDGSASEEAKPSN
jgi:hypothetical protein